MDYFDVVDSRYSHKEKFLSDAVPLDVLEKIAKAGLAAPTGMNSQCVKIVILQNREEVEALCQVVSTDGMLTAPSAIAVLTDTEAYKNSPYNFEMEDYSAAATQMLLAATALGYSSLWLDSPYFNEKEQKEARVVLGASDKYHLRVVLPIGLPDGVGSRREKLPFEARVSYGVMGK
ncbi:MAG: nitroreductase family protein [Oscillospiraceae bacterium]|jgi:nitroreductase|nr:nitroreductase family protein [Oscillospiraceae bacterium]